jgi:nucleotide-binding universal stress UspA family protein
MFQRLLITTDLTDGLVRLAKCVPALAAGGIQQITFLHCVPFWQEGEMPRLDEAKIAQAKHLLSPALVNLPPGVEVKLELPSGRPLDLILDTLKKVQPDLVLTGMPIHSLLSEKLFGSTTLALLQRLTLPMLIFRPQFISVLTQEELDLRCRHLLRSLLIPYDGSDSSDVLIKAIALGVSRQSPLHLEFCHLCWVLNQAIIDGQPAKPSPQSQAILDQLERNLSSMGIQVTTHLRRGNPWLEIQAEALEHDISAIAVSSHNVGKIWELSIPSFTGEMLRRSWHPVLFFPPLP